MYEKLVSNLRERAAWINFPHHGEDYPSSDSMLMMDAADAIEELSKPRWIPVTEADNLPCGEVLALNNLKGSYGFHEYLIGYVGENCESDSGYSCESESEILMNVTHWMPLPTPPKEET